MTATVANPARHSLSSQLLLEYLRKEAGIRLDRLLLRNPAARLAEAQRDVAQAHGFSSWRVLKATVERQAAEEIRACAGFYRDDPARVANVFLAVRMEGGSLVIQNMSGTVMTLQRHADGSFAAPGLPARYGFARDKEGKVAAMTIDVDGRHSRLQRIGEAEAGRIAEAHHEALEDQARPRLPICLPAERLAPYAGHYTADHGLSVDITLEEDGLFAAIGGQQKRPLEAESATAFFFPGMKTQLRFRAGPEDGMAMELHRNGTVTFLSRVRPEEAQASAAAMEERFAEQIRPRIAVTLPAGLLPRYAGRYRLDEARELVVEAEGERLFAQITGQARYEIYAEAEGRFFWTVVPAQISFVVNGDGGISHAILHQGGREVPLARLA